MKNTITDYSMSAKLSFQLASPATKMMLIASLAIGFLAAFLEYSFAIALQLLFTKLGILNHESLAESGLSLKLGFTGTLALVVSIGLGRGLIEGGKVFLSRLSMQSYATNLREAIVSLSLANASKVSNAKALSMFSEETQRASTAMLNLSSLLTALTTAVALAFMCLKTSPPAFALGFALLITFSIPFLLISKKLIAAGNDLSKHWERTNLALSDGIRNNFYLSILGISDREISKAKSSLKEYLYSYKRVFASISIKHSLPSIVGTIIICIIAFMQHRTNSWGAQFSTITFFYLFIRFTQSISLTSSLASDFKTNSKSTINLSEFFKAHSTTTPTHEYQVDNASRNTFDEINIVAHNLSFAYDQSERLFNLISFSVSKGQCLAVVGESGTGKSTLLSIVCGLLKPTMGSVSVNSTESYIVRDQLSKRIGYVGPYPYFIEGTLRDNLLYGLNKSETPSDELISNILRVTQLNDFVESSPENLNMKIDEKAERLSAGQKQRIMLARALLRKPKLLILDEPTANLDEDTETAIILELQAIIKNYTTIVVTHRKAMLQLATFTLDLGTSKK